MLLFCQSYYSYGYCYLKPFGLSAADPLYATGFDLYHAEEKMRQRSWHSRCSMQACDHTTQDRRDKQQSSMPGLRFPGTCLHLKCRISCSGTCQNQATRVFWSRSRRQFVSHSLHLCMSLHKSSYCVGASHLHGFVVRKEMQPNGNSVKSHQNESVFPGVAFVINLHADSDDVRDQRAYRLASVRCLSAWSRWMPMLPLQLAFSDVRHKTVGWIQQLMACTGAQSSFLRDEPKRL